MNKKVIIEKGKDGTYDAVMEFSKDLSFGLVGTGKTVKETIDDFYNTFQEMKKYYKEENEDFPNNLEFDFKYDTASFLQYYSNKFTLAGLQNITGVAQGQLSHYMTGHSKPTKKTAEKIEKSLHQFAEELSQVHFV